MSIKFNGAFRVGGIEHHHPLTSEEIKFLLLILRDCKIEGFKINNFAIISSKLQEEYKLVKEKENRHNNT